MEQDNTKNLILAIVLAVVIIFVFQMLLLPSPDESQQQQQQQQQQAGEQQQTAGQQQTGGQQQQQQAREVPAAERAGLSREERIAADPRVRIETPRLVGSINLRGAIIDDLTLRGYREELEDESDNVHLLLPRGSSGTYFAFLGWRQEITEGNQRPLTNLQDTWQVEGANRTLSPGNPVTLVWQGEGLRVTRRFDVDENYLVTVTDRIENRSGEALTGIQSFAEVQRHGRPENLSQLPILHEGPVAVTREEAGDDGVLDELDYGDVENERQRFPSFGGWFGIKDHYWLAAVMPAEQGESVTGYIEHLERNDVFRAGYSARELQSVEAGGTLETSVRMYLGAKEVDLLNQYREEYNIPRFDWAIDFGWFWFFTQFFLWALKAIYAFVGNFGVAILILTVLTKLLFFPLANKSYRSMSKMKVLQPKMKELRERYSDDRQRLNQEMMALYKKEKVNPAAGCLPILVQIPVFFALYTVLYVSIEMRHAPFFGWVQDLSAPDPTSILNLFGLLPWEAPETGLLVFISIGIWPIVMGVSMFLQQKLNPTPPDPMQQKIFTFLPILFTFMLARFPAGLVVYWAWNNILSMAQQWVIMRRMGVSPGGGLAAATAPAGGGKTAKKKAAESAAAEEEESAEPAQSKPQSPPRGGKRGKKRGRRR